VALLRAAGFEVHDGLPLLVIASEDQAPAIVRLLVEGNVGVARIQPRLATLEETFLQATGGETVGA
jgi:hypothetical protein